MQRRSATTPHRRELQRHNATTLRTAASRAAAPRAVMLQRHEQQRRRKLQRRNVTSCNAATSRAAAPPRTATPQRRNVASCNVATPQRRNVASCNIATMQRHRCCNGASNNAAIAATFARSSKVRPSNFRPIFVGLSCILGLHHY
ncbi:unnamed protein product [Sphagnum balticum]